MDELFAEQNKANDVTNVANGEMIGSEEQRNTRTTFATN